MWPTPNERRITAIETEDIEALKREHRDEYKRFLTGQKKSRNVPPRPKQKRKPKGRKTHRKL